MPVTQADIDVTTRGETLWGTTRCLPKKVPVEFSRDVVKGTFYNAMVDAWYYGNPLPDVTVTFKPGFKPEAKKVKDFIMAHMQTLIPEHDHKMAGAAYLLSQIIELKE